MAGKNKFGEFLKKKMEQGRKNNDFFSILGAVIGIAGLAASYFRKLPYYVVILAIVAFSGYILWKLICLVGYQRWANVGICIQKRIGAVSFKAKVILAVILIFLIGLLGFGVRNHCDTEYYASVVEVYGIPTGVGTPLSPKELSGRAGYWRIDDYPYKKYMTLTYEDSYQQMELMKQYSSAYGMNLFQVPARVVYRYSINKNEDAYTNKMREAEKVSYYSSGKKLLLQLSRTDDNKYKIQTYSAEEKPQLLNATILRLPDDQKAESGMLAQEIEITYNAEGLPQMRRFSSGVYNLYGVNGERYAYDEDGKMSSICYLDAAGKPVCNKLGIMQVHFRYDDSGDLRKIAYYSDETGVEKTEGFYGVFCETLTYDSYGNLTEREQLDRDGRWWNDTNGVTGYKYSYDENGALTREEFYGIGGSPIRENRFDSYSVSFTKSRIDKETVISICMDTAKISVTDQDVPLAKTFFDKTNIRAEEGENLTDLSGNSGRQENNAENPSKEQAFLEEDLSGWKYASIHYIVKNDIIIKMSYHDKEDNLVLNEEGYALKHFAYDDKMRVVEESYWDTNENQCLIDDGYAMIRKTYKKENDTDIEQTEYLDADEKLTFNKKLGYSYVSSVRENGEKYEKVTRYYYDSSGNLIELPECGYAKIEQLYNESGLLRQETYYDILEAPVCRADYGVAQVIYEYAEDGNQIREWYNDIEGRHINRTDTGVAVIHQEFENGQLKKRYYDGYRDGELVSVPDRNTGYSAIQYSYDKGKKQKVQYLGIDGEPVLHNEYGCAAIEYEYDDKGMLGAKYYYGTDGKLVKRGDKGYAIVRYGYDELGRCDSTRFCGTSDEPVISTEYHCAGFDYQYDEWGNETDTWYIGLDGNYMVRRDLGYAYVHYTYDNLGNKKGAKFYDADGKPAIWKEGGYASYENEYQDGNCIENRYYDTEGNLVVRKDGGYAIRTYDYDELGRNISYHYYGTDREPIISKEYCCAGVEYAYDEKGNKTDTWYLGLDGKPMVTTDSGYAHEHDEYDDLGNIRDTKFYNADEEPTVWKTGGYASYQQEYENGNRIESRYYDKEGKLVMRKDSGYAVIKLGYDELNQCISEDYYGTDDKPVINTKYHCAGFRYAYDEQGNKTDIWYVGLDGKNMIRTDLGYAYVHYEYDFLGNEKSAAYYDADGNPAIWKEGGYASCESKYEDGNWKESRYYDTNGELTLRADTGYAIRKLGYDEFGQNISSYYYGTKEEPVISTKYCCAGFEYTYDEKGNQTDTRYINIDTKNMVRRDLGYAREHYEYDESGNNIATMHYNVSDEPAIRKERGYASYKSKYENGNWVESRYYGINGEPVLRKDTGYSVIKLEYDKSNQCIRERYYGTDGEPVISTEYHCAGYDYAYDDRGNKTDVWYVGLDGENIVRTDLGYAHVQYEYDDCGNETGAWYFDANNRPTLRKEGDFASYKYKYENGNWIEESYYDTEGGLTLNKERGYAVRTLVYNELNQHTFDYFYGTNEEAVVSTIYYCAGFRYVYDEQGNRTELWCIGLDGESLMIRSDIGYAYAYSEYDDFGNKTSEKYFDEHNQAIAIKEEGYASYESKYENGNWVESRYYDTDGNLMIRSDTGYAIIKRKYNDTGQCISERYYGIDENPVISTKYHCAGIDYTYDERGNRTYIWYMGLDGTNMVREDMGAMLWYGTYDSYNRLTWEGYYNYDPNLDPPFYLVMRKGSDYAAIQYQYDASGNRTNVTYYNQEWEEVQR